jgi:hypothetical protein
MTGKRAPTKRAAGFIPTMDCLPVPKLPAGPEWTYEIKLDGYRLEAVRSGGKTTLYSRRQNVLTQRFPYIAAALGSLPAGTVIDGELVALGPDGRPDFNLLQNFRSAESRIVYYAFDILIIVDAPGHSDVYCRGSDDGRRHKVLHRSPLSARSKSILAVRSSQDTCGKRGCGISATGSREAWACQVKPKP